MGAPWKLLYRARGLAAKAHLGGIEVCFFLSSSFFRRKKKCHDDDTNDSCSAQYCGFSDATLRALMVEAPDGMQAPGFDDIVRHFPDPRRLFMPDDEEVSSSPLEEEKL